MRLFVPLERDDDPPFPLPPDATSFPRTLRVVPESLATGRLRHTSSIFRLPTGRSVGYDQIESVVATVTKWTGSPANPLKSRV